MHHTNVRFNEFFPRSNMSQKLRYYMNKIEFFTRLNKNIKSFEILIFDDFGFFNTDDVIINIKLKSFY